MTWCLRMLLAVNVRKALAQADKYNRADGYYLA
jgi:hypothetical protein